MILGSLLKFFTKINLDLRFLSRVCLMEFYVFFNHITLGSLQRQRLMLPTWALHKF